ncbi:hypothetical protein KDA82_36790, partial [Streptomyces daliensis]|nr:hypothetical protein [Streptomyces daliensis]
MSLNEAIDVLRSLAGPVKVERVGTAPRDVRDTGADISLAARAFGYVPRVALRDGLATMLDEHWPGWREKGTGA